MVGTNNGDAAGDWREVVQGSGTLTWEVWARGIHNSKVLTESGREVLLQAVDQIESFLGTDWLQRHRPDIKPDRPGLPLMSMRWWPENDVRHVHLRLLEFALKLRLLEARQVPGRVAVRTSMRGDIGHFAHSVVQLEVAALALRAGWATRLEPPPATIGGSKTDLLLTKGDQTMAVEVKTFVADDLMRTDMRRGDRVHVELRKHSSQFGVAFDGEIGLPETEEEFQALISWVIGLGETAKNARENLSTTDLTVPTGGRLSVLPDELAERTELTMSIREADPLRRLLSKIGEKANQGLGNAPLWLRFNETPLFYLRAISQDQPVRIRSLHQLVRTIERRLALHPHVAGLVLSQEPQAMHTQHVSHIRRLPGAAKAIACTTHDPWYRETLIVLGPNRPRSAGQPDEWSTWYANEDTWLDWALAELRLPSRHEIAVDR